MLDPLDWTLPSERLRPWLGQADELATHFAERAVVHDREGSFPFENFRDLQAARFHLLPVPQEFGGWGCTIEEAVRVIERLARGDGATALVFAMHLQVLGGASEGRPWTEERFAHLCRAVVADGGFVNSTATEPELGSPSRGGLPATTATRVEGGWRINGRKTWSSGSPVLGHFLAPAVLNGPDLAADTIGVFDLRPDMPGLRIEETWNVMGMRTTGSHDLVLEQVVVRDEDLLVERAPGTPDAGRASSGAWFGMVVSAVYLGVATAARDQAIRFAQERRPTALGGKAIATLEVIQQRLGALESELLPARSLLYSIARSWASWPERRPELMAHVGATKVLATHNAIAATDLAMRIVGGTAMERSFPLERLFRDVRAGLFHPPAEEAGHARLGQALFAAAGAATETEYP
ncbi:MAG: acyl-CoA dehydrogenase family protein [Herpetosiphon sp.]